MNQAAEVRRAHLAALDRAGYPSAAEIRSELSAIARQYPPDLIDQHITDVPRITFHIRLVLRSTGTRACVCDIGGGTSLFSLGCAAFGLQTTLVDDFADNPPFLDERLSHAFADLLDRYGVKLVKSDVVREHTAFAPAVFDAVTSFHSMEHWHHSPKAFFHRLIESLKPGGLFLLCGPNCVNLRKRFTVALGSSNWSSMDDWYENEVFRGHVREPSADDLRYIGRDLGLTEISVFGRNWLGFNSRWAVVRKVAPLADPLLRGIPSLCSDIYLEGFRR